MAQPLPFCVYVLRSQKDGGLYVGYTTDLERRFGQHLRGENRSTAPRRPLDLIFCEHYSSAEDAQRREKYLKTSVGKRGLKLMLRETLKRNVADAKKTCPEARGAQPESNGPESAPRMTRD